MIIWCIGMIVNKINMDHTNRVVNIKYSCYHANLNLIGFHTHFPVSFSGKKGAKRKEEQKGKKGGKEVKPRDRISEFPLWRPVPHGRDVTQTMIKGLYLLLVWYF